MTSHYCFWNRILHYNLVKFLKFEVNEVTGRRDRKTWWDPTTAWNTSRENPAVHPKHALNGTVIKKRTSRTKTYLPPCLISTSGYCSWHQPAFHYPKLKQCFQNVAKRANVARQKYFFSLKRGRGGCSGVWYCRATTQLIVVVNANWLLGLLFSNVLKCVSSHLTWELWEVTLTPKWFYFISCNSSNYLNLHIVTLQLCFVWEVSAQKILKGREILR